MCFSTPPPLPSPPFIRPFPIQAPAFFSITPGHSTPPPMATTTTTTTTHPLGFATCPTQVDPRVEKKKGAPSPGRGGVYPADTCSEMCTPRLHVRRTQYKNMYKSNKKSFWGEASISLHVLDSTYGLWTSTMSVTAAAAAAAIEQRKQPTTA